MTLQERMNQRILIYDGAMGTMLQAAGMKPGECPELWNLNHPDAVRKVHEAYLEAGSDLILTNTFGGSMLKLAEYGLQHQTAAINAAAANLARQAANLTNALAVGTVGPCGQFIQPFGPYTFEQVVESFVWQIQGLVDGGVDIINIETMADLAEMRAALIAAKEVTSLPVIAQMTFADRQRTVLGTDPLTAVSVMEALGADVVGANCSGGPEELLPVMEIMARKASRPLVVKPNAGLPKLVNGKTVFPASPEDMAQAALHFAQLGVRIIGGCCGNTPSHISAIRDALKGVSPVIPTMASVSRLSSRTSTLEVEFSGAPVIIGERINPTGKKKLAEELRAGHMTRVRQMAREQEAQGADLLDVNVGAAGVDEKTVLAKAVQAISGVVNCPLVLDTADPKVLEDILRVYPGKALVNSVTGEKESMQFLFPLIKRYGAAVIALAMDEGGIPEDAETKVRIAEKILAEADRYGIARDDIFIDCLVMTAAAKPEASRETLKAVQMVRERLQVRTVLGVSNISHGLPERDSLNSVFLAAALSHGLDMVIMDPGNTRMQETMAAWNVLAGNDRGAVKYIEKWAGKTAKTAVRGDQSEIDSELQLRQAILDGDRAGAADQAQSMIDKGENPLETVNQILIPALESVGELYEQGQYFLPQLLLAAEAAEGAFQVLKGHMASGETVHAGTVVLATVKGDIHDIGKNIVSILLENHGYRIVDLGKDVPKEIIAQSAVEEKADIIGLSALMTTTMLEMEKTIQYLKSQHVPSTIMVGGAVLTADFADAAGADAYGLDAQDAVRKASLLMKKKTP